MSSALITHQTALSGQIVLLSRFLRSKGFSISPADEADALRALTHLPIDNKTYFTQSLKSIFSKNRFHYQNFDAYYEEYWDQLSKASDAKIKKRPDSQKKNNEARQRELRFEALKDWLNLTPSKDEKVISSYSDLEVLTRKHFADLSEDEMRLMMRMLQKLARKIVHRKSRLSKRSVKRRKLDLKYTIRANMRQGGEINQVVFSERKHKKLRLVLLCDVSRSMELYSRFFVHLIYAFQNAHDRVETFVFSTALHRVSDLLDAHEFEKAFATISERVPHWSGGTTIGSCLQKFIDEYGHSLLNRKTVVFILSDGWDTGRPENIQEAMKHLHSRSRKLIWLNPLAGNPDFSPEAIGMKTALKYLDALAPAHNLESLKRALLQLRSGRNLRSQEFLGGQKVSV